MCSDTKQYERDIGERKIYLPARAGVAVLND